jgi:aquaporin Z
MLGVALAFGLTVVGMAYAIGHISGAHMNPAVSLGLFMGGRMSAKDLVPYIVAQVVGGLIAGVVLLILLKSQKGTQEIKNAFGGNNYKDVGVIAALLTEFFLTFGFVFIIMGATSKRAPAHMAGLVIGLTLTLVHIIGIAVTGTSVNPARSLGVAIFERGDALKHLWLFLLAPPAGGVAGALTYKFIDPEG